MDEYLIWGIYGMCFMKFPHVVWIRQKKCRHEWFVFLIGWYIKNLLLWNRLAKCINIWYGASMEGIYKDCSFPSDESTSMAAMDNSCFWLPDTLNIFSSETAWPNGLIFGMEHLWKVLYKISSFRPNQNLNMAPLDYLIGWYIKNLLLWNHLTKWINIWYGASMEGPL